MRDKKSCLFLHLTAVFNDDGLCGLVLAISGNTFHFVDDLGTIDHLTKHGMLAVQPRSLHSGDEELRSVGVGSSVGHREKVFLSVLQSKVLVVELGSIDGLATSSIATSEIASLAHELRDDAVEGRALVMKFLAEGAGALLTRAERAEVLCGLRHCVFEQFHDNLALTGTTDRDIEEDLGVPC